MTEITFVLCDDNADDLNELRVSADEYLQRRVLRGETVCFSSPDEVLRYAEAGGGNGATVYILDVIMPGIDGIELGKRIRECDKSSAVIYLSVSRE